MPAPDGCAVPTVMVGHGHIRNFLQCVKYVWTGLKRGASPNYDVGIHFNESQFRGRGGQEWPTRIFRRRTKKLELR